MERAFKKVVSNGGAAGVDGMQTGELKLYLQTNWPEIKSRIESGTYKPSPVRSVSIPKPNGGERLLGIPTVTDRLIQQGISQVLTEIYDPTFSAFSYGFRPGKSAHQAAAQAKQYLNEGYTTVLELDLEKFFDKVNHDRLMSKLAQTITDKKLLLLMRKYLTSGIMQDGLVNKPTEGTPQGSPLSPLLSNIVLDELDKELEKRGLRFVRYADDCSIYLKSARAGERVKEGISAFIEKTLRLKVNQEKSKISVPSKSSLLGFSFYKDIEGWQLRIHGTSYRKLKAKIRQLTKRRYTVSLESRIEKLTPVMRGWVNYFKIAKAQKRMQALDEWCRSRLRASTWVLWKRIRTRIRELEKLGISPAKAYQYANTRIGPTKVAHSPILLTSLHNPKLESLGYTGFLATYLKRT
jgi:RNA-directed DNA polymerase